MLWQSVDPLSHVRDPIVTGEELFHSKLASTSLLSGHHQGHKSYIPVDLRCSPLSPSSLLGLLWTHDGKIVFIRECLVHD